MMLTLLFRGEKGIREDGFYYLIFIGKVKKSSSSLYSIVIKILSHLHHHQMTGISVPVFILVFLSF